jgi:hypothetical protein
MRFIPLITIVLLLHLSSCAASNMAGASGQHSFYRIQLHQQSWPELAEQLQHKHRLQLRIQSVHQPFSNKEQLWLFDQAVQLRAGHYQLQTEVGPLSVTLQKQQNNWLLTVEKAGTFSRQNVMQLLAQLKLSSSYRFPDERNASYLAVRDIFISADPMR